MEAHSGYRYGPAVPVVGRVFDELIIKAYVGLPQNRDVVVGLDDLFRSRMGQLTVTDDNAEATSV